MIPSLLSPSGSPTPNGDNNSFKQKLINYCIAAIMVVCEIARHYNLIDLVQATDLVKWILEIIALLL